MDIKILINIILINLSIIIIWEISGFITDLTKIIYEKINKKPWIGQSLPKPFSCWYCMCVWINLIYLLLNQVNLIHSISITCLFTYFNTILRILLIKINRYLQKYG